MPVMQAELTELRGKARALQEKTIWISREG
jgi:hypothetical protein